MPTVPSSKQPLSAAQPTQPTQPTPAPPQMAPGDEAPAGSPGTGEGVCRACGGTGHMEGDAAARVCPRCLGTGKVTVGIGGA